jgi:hypothetical protein
MGLNTGPLTVLTYVITSLWHDNLVLNPLAYEWLNDFCNCSSSQKLTHLATSGYGQSSVKYLPDSNISMIWGLCWPVCWQCFKAFTIPCLFCVSVLVCRGVCGSIDVIKALRGKKWYLYSKIII